ncbi:hypothetical protein [Reichenbachiella sp. MALMAid0571]|uniref:hypothetical protein n=1 Tax=Reichenbachiella sp. MALMAid0571 TaxID=3143939 RepID=UPI0032DE4D9C
MDKTPTIFISYNPKSEEEQTLAVRLHSIGAVSGFKVFLPDRYNSDKSLDFETKNRIDESDFFIIFPTMSLSKIVQEEIDYAFKRFKDKSKILVIDDQLRGIKIKKSHLFTKISFNSETESIDEATRKVLEIIKSIESSKSTVNGFLALLGIGLGLFILSEIFKEK